MWLKAECLQKTGSFKPRGAINRVITLTDAQRAAGLITVSSGNHAQGLAYAAGQLDVACTVVMPDTAPASKIAATRHYGATVELRPDVTSALEHALELAESGLTLAHPYDDAMVIAGQGTVALEILEDVPDVDVVVVPIGGGGLISGIATAIKAQKPDARVVGVEPIGAGTLTIALAAGAPVAMVPSSIADGLGAPVAGSLTLPIVESLVDEVVTVTDDQIASAMATLAASAKLVTEPAGATAVAALEAGLIGDVADANVVAVCTGGNIDLDRFAELISGRA